MSVRFKSGYWIVVVMLLCSLHAEGQRLEVAGDTVSRGKIIVDHIEKLIEDLQGPEAVKWLYGGFRLRIDSTYIYGDSAVVFGDHRVHAFRDVVIQQGDSLEVFTDTLYYSTETDIAELVGTVVLRQGTKQLWTQNLNYHLRERFGEYHQGGVLVDRDLQVSSRTGLYLADTEEVIFRDSVIVLHSKVNLAADSLKYVSNESRVIFTGPTNLYTPEARIYTEAGYYDLQTETSEFNRNAQYAGQDKKGTADTIRYTGPSGEVLMMGHVVVEELDRRISGDRLKYLEASGDTWVFGSPAIYRDSLRVVEGLEIFYQEKTQKVTTAGKGKIRDGTLVMEAERFDYDQSSGKGTADGNVMWFDTAAEVGIRTEHLDFSKEDQFARAYGVQRSLLFVLVDGDTLFIGADTLHRWAIMDTTGAKEDTTMMIRAYPDVRLFKSDMQGRTDSLVFHGKDSVFTFFGTPVLWSDTTQFSADSIRMTLRQKQIHEIYLNQKAIIISELLHTYYDQIKGKYIIARFDSNAIRQMWVHGNAESIYYTLDEQDAFIGVNKTICSKMYFTFDSGKIELLKYYGDNSSDMWPMREASHGTLRLEGFSWRIDEKPLSVEDVLK